MAGLVRHFLAVLVAVGLVVALGFVWSRSGAAGIVSDGGRGGQPVPASVGQGGSPPRPGDGGVDRRGANGLSLSNIDDLLQSLVVEGLIVAGVIAVDRVRRSRRRARRSAEVAAAVANA